MFGSQSERSRIVGEHPVPSDAASDAVIFGKSNYYSRFIENVEVYASVLYKLREADSHEINRVSEAPKPTSAVRPDAIYEGGAGGNRDLYPKSEINVDRYPIAGDDRDPEGRNRWEKAMIAFFLLKAKIATTPILKNFDPDRSPVIVVYASKWAVSAALLQEYDGVYWPVTFSSRTLKPNEVNYGMVEKEVLALLRMLDICYTMLVSREITVLTRYSTLAWLLQSSGLNGRLGGWAALLSNWTLN